jgi:hypothetical protein
MIFTGIKGTPLFSSTRFFAAARGKYFYPSSTDLLKLLSRVTGKG